MKLRKVFLLALLLVAGIVLAACEDNQETTLSKLTFEGVSTANVEFGAEFNVLTGVRAKGDDGKYYDELIEFSSIAQAQNRLDAEGNLDTEYPGTVKVNYLVRKGDVQAQVFRDIIVGQPEAVEGQMIINGDFSQGMAGWTDPGVNYNADGSAMVLSNDQGTLKAEVTAGANVYTPRFGQQNIKFEKGKTYEVSFKAKSLVAKTINLQVGELLTAAPWFTDFKPGQTVHKLITTEWATYSYKFTMNLETNPRGAITFELGSLNGDSIHTTMWFDDILIEESVADPDTEGPAFTGILPTQNILKGSVFNPRTGVTVYDVGDAEDLTEMFTVKIYDAEDKEVGAVDTSKEGVYKLVYKAIDTKDNVTEVTAYVNVVGLIFSSTNLVINGGFAAAFGEGDLATWTLWKQDWATAPVVEMNHDVVAKKVSIDITGGGDAAWSVQFTQPVTAGLFLELGQTYKFSATIKAEVARKINVAIGHGNENFVEFARKNGLELVQGENTVEFMFTVSKESADVKLVFELGQQEGFADGLLEFTSVGLFELVQDDVVKNSTFDLTGWRGFTNDWEGSAITSGIVNGEYKLVISNLNNGGAANWVLQLIQDLNAIGGASDNGLLVLEASKTYVLSFDAYASEAAVISPVVAVPNVWTNFVETAKQNVTIGTTKSTYTVEFTTPAAIIGNEILKFEFGNAFGGSFTTEKFIAFDNIFVTLKDSETKLASVHNGTFDQIIGFGFHAAKEENSISIANGEVVINVGSLGEQAYEPHFFYDGITLQAGSYVATLKMKSSVARDFRFNITAPNQGYRSLLEGNKHDFEISEVDKYVWVTVEFEIDALIDGVKLEVDFGPLGEDLVSAPGVFTFDQVLIYKLY